MDVQRTTSSIIDQIESCRNTTQKSLRDKYAQEEARKLVPIAELVQDNLDILEGDYLDNLLPHVVRWFSTDFFQWFSTPPCDKCQKELEPSSDYINAMGLQVERYKCCSETCDFIYDFIRHNDPAILLTTRRGRCGEWANCFMIILKALDYDARLVLDITDHVWNEVWSNSKQCWIHVDPCEAIVDAPLLYEVGWTKKLVYCFAFGQHEVLDVTRRYALDFKSTKAMRNIFDDQLIQQHLDVLSYELINRITDSDMRSTVMNRRRTDIEQMKRIELEPRKVPDAKEYSMRKTGSLSWRIQRGEYIPKLKNGFVISVVETSKPENQSCHDNFLFSLKYNSDKNMYDCSMEQYCNKGSWSTMTYLYENLDYKYERDWKTSYIARYETCSYDTIGKIKWRLDLSSLEQRWHKLEIYLSGKVYPNTNITVNLQHCETKDSENYIQEKRLNLNVTNTILRNTFQPTAAVFDLTAELSGGDPMDDVGWQKPQLFRQTRGENSHENALVINVY